MERKCGKFSFKLFVPFTVHLTSNKNLFSLINKDKIQVKTKYNVSLLKPYLDSDEKKNYTWWKPPPSAISEQSHGTAKVDPPSLRDKQILIEERIDNYAITYLPNEIFEMILIDAVY